MARDEQIERCRLFYTMERRALKSPPMIAIKHPWGWSVEAKDGSIFIEYCEQTHCSWCVKSEGVLAWHKNAREINPPLS